jgi:hypothetical protein
MYKVQSTQEARSESQETRAKGAQEMPSISPPLHCVGEIGKKHDFQEGKHLDGRWFLAF